jgi:hypothetical protein
MPGDTTPARPLTSQNPALTRPEDPSSPLNLGRSSQRQKLDGSNKTHEAPPIISQEGGKSGTKQQTDKQYEALIQKITTEKEVVGLVGSTLDNLVANFRANKQKEHEKAAQRIVGQIIQRLNKDISAQTGGILYAKQPGEVGTAITLSNAKPPRAEEKGGRTTWAGVAQRAQPTPEVICISDRSSPRARSGAGPTPVPNAGPSVRARPDRPAEPKEDLRVFLRMPPDYKPYPQPNPYAVRSAIATATGIPTKDIPVVQRIRTGWAIKAANKGVQQKLVEMESEIATETGALEVCKPEVWRIYAIPKVPYQQHDLAGNLYTADQCIAQEAAIETGIQPVQCKMSKKGVNRETNTATWIVAFKQPVRVFRLFGSSAPSKEIKKTPRIELHSSGCQGYCVQARCNRDQRCRNCGQSQKEHVRGEGCYNPTKCANCAGPFQAGHEGCPAAPVWEDGRLRRPTKSQLIKIRKHGQQQYAASIAPGPAPESPAEQEQSASPALNSSRHAPGHALAPVDEMEEDEAEVTEEALGVEAESEDETDQIRAQLQAQIRALPARRSTRIAKRGKPTKPGALSGILVGRKALSSRQETTPPSN